MVGLLNWCGSVMDDNFSALGLDRQVQSDNM